MFHNTQQSAGCSNHPSSKPQSSSITHSEECNRPRASYKGVRRRKSSGKWVSEIREPKIPTRIWLGSYPTQEMAAVAYDVAALALRGPGTQLNFPDIAASFPVPQSSSPRDIQVAAAAAAAAVGAATDALNSEKRECLIGQNDEGNYENNNNIEGKRVEECFVDEDLVFDMPNVLVNMAQGMLLSPPRLDVPPDVDDDNDYFAISFSGENLWNHL